MLPELKPNNCCFLKDLLAIRENNQPRSDGISIIFKTDRSVKREGTELTGVFFLCVLFYFFYSYLVYAVCTTIFQASFQFMYMAIIFEGKLPHSDRYII